MLTTAEQKFITDAGYNHTRKGDALAFELYKKMEADGLGLIVSLYDIKTYFEEGCFNARDNSNTDIINFDKFLDEAVDLEDTVSTPNAFIKGETYLGYNIGIVTLDVKGVLMRLQISIDTVSNQQQYNIESGGELPMAYLRGSKGTYVVLMDVYDKPKNNEFVMDSGLETEILFGGNFYSLKELFKEYDLNDVLPKTNGGKTYFN